MVVAFQFVIAALGGRVKSNVVIPIEMKMYYELITIIILSLPLLSGCVSVNENINVKDLSNYENISSELFIQKYLNEEESKECYLGFGQTIKFNGGNQAFEISFNQIFYNSADSSLYLKGNLVDIFNSNSISNIQIVVVRLNENIEYGLDPKYIEYYNYKISESGEFVTEVRIHNDKTKLIFGAQPNYVNGEYIGASINSMYVFDIYKLLK